ncbi:unnamed protein product [Gongylonema pulchrum]|uniref:Uncharacterized protein n=1 Tax=Gongylonema pulchrum TaxID=637853 RepID=A0A3P6PKE6_9BILA|nr:unnamed protein product [Gongylonema pulchrum]
MLFLIGLSGNVNKTEFQQALQIVENTVQHFDNIGPDGLQVSLVHFTHEPVLEFSFRKHNCKPCLIADIADTEYMNGLLHRSNITVLMVLMKNSNPELFKQLLSENPQNLFNATGIDEKQVADELEQRVRSIVQEKWKSFGTTVTITHDESIKKFGAQCLADGFNVTVTVLRSFGGVVAVRGKAATGGCSKVVQAEQFGENITTREIHLFINFDQCGLHPPGNNFSVVVNVMHDKWLVTGADKAFLLQCHRARHSVDENLSAELNIRRGIKVAETLPLGSVPPQCKYTIRKDSPDGQLAQGVVVGDLIYHRWDCENDHRITFSSCLRIFLSFFGNEFFIHTHKLPKEYFLMSFCAFVQVQKH